jgi:hypothetical protein
MDELDNKQNNNRPQNRNQSQRRRRPNQRNSKNQQNQNRNANQAAQSNNGESRTNKRPDNNKRNQPNQPNQRDNNNSAPWGMNPLPTQTGIQTRSQRGEFAKNWWARRWLEALERLMQGVRLSRGQYYARLGQIVSLEEIKGGCWHGFRDHVPNLIVSPFSSIPSIINNGKKCWTFYLKNRFIWQSC